jgi:glycine cleavage system H protein
VGLIENLGDLKMSETPTELKYAKTHEWARNEGDGTITVGITDHAQDQLGDLVFVELPEVGAEVAAGGDCAVVESVKAASDIYSPVAGEIIAVNGELEEAPEMVNEEPYGTGWLFKVKMADASELDALLDADGYTASVAEDE